MPERMNVVLDVVVTGCWVGSGKLRFRFRRRNDRSTTTTGSLRAKVRGPSSDGRMGGWREMHWQLGGGRGGETMPKPVTRGALAPISLKRSLYSVSNSPSLSSWSSLDASKLNTLNHSSSPDFEFALLGDEWPFPFIHTHTHSHTNESRHYLR